MRERERVRERKCERVCVGISYSIGPWVDLSCLCLDARQGEEQKQRYLRKGLKTVPRAKVVSAYLAAAVGIRLSQLLSAQARVLSQTSAHDRVVRPGSVGRQDGVSIADTPPETQTDKALRRAKLIHAICDGLGSHPSGRWS